MVQHPFWAQRLANRLICVTDEIRRYNDELSIKVASWTEASQVGVFIRRICTHKNDWGSFGGLLRKHKRPEDFMCILPPVLFLNKPVFSNRTHQLLWTDVSTPPKSYMLTEVCVSINVRSSISVPTCSGDFKWGGREFIISKRTDCHHLHSVFKDTE